MKRDEGTGDLFAAPPKPPRETRADQIFRRFCEFHKANPRVWTLFKRFTFELIHAGFEHHGAGAVVERIRWHTNIETRSEDGLKISNDLRAYYARLFHAAHPQHDGFFRNRKRRSEDRPAHGDDSPTVDMTPPEDETRLFERLRELLRETGDGVAS